MNKRVDPELKYCPQCGDEYRADIKKCAACEIDLLSGTEVLVLLEEKNSKTAEKSNPITADDELIDIRKGSVIEIKQTKLLLEREGIPSVIANESGNCKKGCCGPDVLLKVRTSDMQEVGEIFSKLHIESTSLGDHDLQHAGAVFNVAAENTTCPACGHQFPTSSTTCPDCGLCFA